MGQQTHRQPVGLLSRRFFSSDRVAGGFGAKKNLALAFVGNTKSIKSSRLNAGQRQPIAFKTFLLD
jgi:hypothetical protein